MSRPINPPVCRGPRGNDLPAYVANGLIGLRVREVPFVPGLAMVNGIAGLHPQRRIEASLAVPYPLAGDLIVNGVAMRDQPWSVDGLRQGYDFATGELESAFRFRAGRVTANVVVTTFASRSAPSLLLQEVAVECSATCELAIASIVDPADCRGTILRRHTETPGEEGAPCDAAILWQPDGGISQCGIAMVTGFSGGQCQRQIKEWDEHGALQTRYTLHVKSGQAVRLRQIVAMIPSLLHARPDEEAVRRVVGGHRLGFDRLRQENRESWADLWQGRIVVRGAQKRHQALIDAAFFYLNCSVHPASPAATSMFGLATWNDYHYYFGHVMWDIDAFCLAPLIVMQPDAARALLDFRTRGVAQARNNARLGNRAGLQFPWQAAPSTAQEAAPGSGSAAASEDHVSLHVARAFSLFADITGDSHFKEGPAWTVLSGVADWIASRVTRTKRGFEMLRVTGPAEVPEPPDNDAFTLMAARDVLNRAIKAAGSLGEVAPERWQEVRDNLYLPLRSDDALAAHDAFRIDEHKGATPSPLAGLFPLDHPLSDEQRLATLALFLSRWRDYVGAPMLPALYGIWASMAGERDLARKLFEEGYAGYDHGRFHQCLEYRADHPDSKVAAGPFFANLGGMLLGLLFGYTGLVIDEGDPSLWPRRPICLPRGWKAIEVERLWIRGRAARLVARDGATRAQLDFG